MTAGERRRLVVAAVAVVAVVVLVAVAVAGFSSGSGGPAGITSAQAFDLPALGGPGRVRLADLRGTPVLVTLFASWCSACRTELPAVARVAADNRGRLAVVAVNSKETGDGAAMAGEFGLAAAGVHVARDVHGSPAEGLFDAYGAVGMPVTAAYDAEGRLVRTYKVGLNEAELRAEVASLLGTSGGG